MVEELMEGRQFEENQAVWKKDQIIQFFWNSQYSWAVGVGPYTRKRLWSVSWCECTNGVDYGEMGHGSNEGCVNSAVTSLPVQSLSAYGCRMLFE